MTGRGCSTTSTTIATVLQARSAHGHRAVTGAHSAEQPLAGNLSHRHISNAASYSPLRDQGPECHAFALPRTFTLFDIDHTQGKISDTAYQLKYVFFYLLTGAQDDRCKVDGKRGYIHSGMRHSAHLLLK